MKEIDQMLKQWIHNSIIRAKLRELIIKMDKMVKAIERNVAEIIMLTILILSWVLG